MKPYQFKSQENLSLRQRVFADIRDAIVRGHLKPGDKLRELDISKQMNVSRGPLREALRDLEALGLVVSSPLSGDGGRRRTQGRGRRAADPGTAAAGVVRAGAKPGQTGRTVF
ncbi:GntR family transcriptional regulator [Cohnella ginsengisoli]|uniref:GntR family transcriptional regulator n=1 Tax=Cohnella ginsengisoli TaxID=425004 RepID=A0A9X4KNC1_9BACL|nr:GntR family transcriptional regulator [Cohnella ginsengisoli]MDG0793187.1 GntR family transcriptional regulator [Cohnella ginsengisoli]